MSDLFPDSPLVVSIEDQIACVERELKYRRRVYWRRVEARKMSRALADLEIAKMQAVLSTLQRVKAGAPK